MYRIIDNRNTGKTSRLLLLAKEHNGIVVCMWPKAMQEKAYAYGLTGIDFMSYNDFIQKIKDEEVVVKTIDGCETVAVKGVMVDKPIFVDELEALFNKICFNKFAGYTLSSAD